MTKPVYVVFGPDAYLRTEAIRTVARRELGAEGDNAGPTRFDGNRANLAEVLDEVRTFSLLGDRRVVIIDDADGFLTRHREGLERYLAGPSDSGCLILDCENFDARTRLYKAVQKIGEAIKCESPRGRALIAWIAQQATARYGKSLGPGAAERLRELAGDSVGALDGELSKLTAYVGSRPAIAIKDVEALVGNNRAETVFAVLDAIANGDAPAALANWEQVLATDRAAPNRAIGGLAWGIRRLLDAKAAASAGTPISQLARQFWTEPAVLKRRLDRLTIRELEDCLSDLLSADLDSKTGFSTVASAVEKFIIRHTVTDHRRARAVSGG